MTWTKETFPYKARTRAVGQVQIDGRMSQYVYSIWLFTAANIRCFKRRRHVLMHLDSHMNVSE